MSRLLRVLGIVVFVLGCSAGTVAVHRARGDTYYYRTLRALERHPDHILYKSEFALAQARHSAFLAVAALGIGGGILWGSALYGLGEVLRRVDALSAQGGSPG